MLGMKEGRFTSAELSHAYRTKVRQHHPDLHGPEQETTMRLINLARDTLRQFADEPEPVAPPKPKPAARPVSSKAPPPQAKPEEETEEAAFSFADTGLFRRMQREKRAGREVWQRRRS